MCQFVVQLFVGLSPRLEGHVLLHVGGQLQHQGIIWAKQDKDEKKWAK